MFLAFLFVASASPTPAAAGFTRMGDFTCKCSIPTLGCGMIMFDGKGDNEGSAAEQVDKCAAACSAKQAPHAEDVKDSWDVGGPDGGAFVALGFIVKSGGSGRCICTNEVSSCPGGMIGPPDPNGYKRFDFNEERGPSPTADTCVGTKNLALAFGTYPPTGASNDLCPAFSSSCATVQYHLEDCDTCGKSKVGFTPSGSIALAEKGLTISVMAKPHSTGFFYGEILGQQEAFNLGWYPSRGVSGCSPGYAQGMNVGEWNHLVLRYTQTGCSLYINGARHDGRESISAISARVNGKLRPGIGCRASYADTGKCAGDYHFSGDRGAVGATAIWNRALSDGEVQVLTNEGQNSLTTAMCAAPTMTTTTDKPAPVTTPITTPAVDPQVLARLAALEASNAALTAKLAKFEVLEAKLEQLSLLKVEKSGSMCTVQCDNGRDSGILELD